MNLRSKFQRLNQLKLTWSVMLHSYGKRKDKDGLLIFFDSISRQVVWHKFIQSETKENYLEGLNFYLKKVFKY